VNAHAFENVLVALDDSAVDATALEWALSLCTVSRAKLTVVAITAAPEHAPSGSPIPSTTRAGPSRMLLDAKRQAQDHGLNVRVELLLGPSQHTIITYAAAHHHDLIVLQHRGRCLRELLHPHPTDFAAPHHACPVIVIG
jgi:nucleotide-binding universal stress UspA family protein